MSDNTLEKRIEGMKEVAGAGGLLSYCQNWSILFAKSKTRIVELKTYNK